VQRWQEEVVGRRRKKKKSRGKKKKGCRKWDPLRKKATSGDRVVAQSLGRGKDSPKGHDVGVSAWGGRKKKRKLVASHEEAIKYKKGGKVPIRREEREGTSWEEAGT